MLLGWDEDFLDVDEKNRCTIFIYSYGVLKVKRMIYN